MSRKNSIPVVLLALALLAPVLSGRAGLYEDFLNPPREYGEVPFWWWSGDRLDKERIGRQLEQIGRASCRERV